MNFTIIESYVERKNNDKGEGRSTHMHLKKKGRLKFKEKVANEGMHKTELP